MEFIYKDGTSECYDPISDWVENDVAYYFFVGGNDYYIHKSEIKSLREYDLCADCGYELFEEGCRRCISEKELEQLKNETTNSNRL